jgi:hypothetical protein
MKKNYFLIITSVISLGLSGCNAMYSKPEEREAANRAMPDYILCEKIVIDGWASDEIRHEWAAEINRRGVNCGQYAALINTKIQQRNQSNQHLREVGTALLNGQPAPVRSQPQGGGVATSVGFYKKEYTSGHNKICVYDRLGSEAAITIGAAEICPPSIQ